MDTNQSWLARWKGQGFWREMERSFVLLFFLIVGLNIALKLPHIGTSGIFLDEAASIFRTQGSFGETVDFSLKDPTPPLYYLTLWGWTKCFGITEASARFPSMLFSALAGGMIFLLGRRLGNVKVGFFAGLFYTFSGLHLNFAQEARAYAMAICLLLISYYLFAGLFDAEGRSKKHLIGLALVNTMLLYTHYSMAFPLIVQGFLALRLLKLDRKTFFYFALADIVAIASIAPWYIKNHELMPPGKVSSWLKPPGLDGLLRTAIYLTGGSRLALVALLLAVLGIIFVILKWKFVRAELRMGKYGILIALGLVLFAPALQFIASHLVAPVFGGRYLLYASAAIYLLLGLILGLLPWKKWLPVSLFGVFVMLQLVQLNLAPKKSEDWKGVVEKVKTWENEGSRIVICAHYQKMPFSYYYRNDLFQKKDSLGYFLFKNGVFEGCSPTVAPKINGNTVSNIILVLSGEELVDPENLLYDHLYDQYCLTKKARFKSIDLYQFTAPPCDSASFELFTWNYEEARIDGDDSMLLEIPDAPSGKRVAFVAPGKDYSVIFRLPGEALFDNKANRVELKARIKMSEGEGRFRMVYSMANGTDGYDWQAVNLEEKYEKGKWVSIKSTLAIPPLKSASDEISVYFWAMEGKEAWFDDLSLEFYNE